MRVEYYTPKLWELVEQGEIKKNSALYHWLNKDEGNVVVDGNVFWVETNGLYNELPNAKATKQIVDIMLEKFGKKHAGLDY